MTGTRNRVYEDTRYGRYFVANHNDPFFDDSLRYYGEWSWGEVEFWKHLLDPGDVVIHGGANIGCHMVALAQLVGPQGMVLAFEPQLELWRCAMANAVLCNVEQVCSVIYAALGAGDGHIGVPMMDFDSRNSFGGLSLIHTDPTGALIRQVPQRAIDSFTLDRCHLIQLDIEGMERQALEGARETLNRLRPKLYLEVTYPQEREPLFDLLREAGYEAWWHVIPLFNPQNHVGFPEDLWPGALVESWVACHVSEEPPEVVRALPPVRPGTFEVPAP